MRHCCARDCYSFPISPLPTENTFLSMPSSSRVGHINLSNIRDTSVLFERTDNDIARWTVSICDSHARQDSILCSPSLLSPDNPLPMNIFLDQACLLSVGQEYVWLIWAVRKIAWDVATKLSR